MISAEKIIELVKEIIPVLEFMLSKDTAKKVKARLTELLAIVEHQEYNNEHLQQIIDVLEQHEATNNWLGKRVGVSKDAANKNLSGVEKYLVNGKSTSVTGVSKYLAKKVVDTKRSLKVSGVEKYLVKRGTPHAQAEDKGYLYLVWFGTSRKPVDIKNIENGFNSQRSDTVSYGQCDVYIPESHRFGEIGRSRFKRWLNFDFKDDRLNLQQITSYQGADDFWQQIQNCFAENNIDEREALVFLHGYNTSFEEAAIRAAQIGFDLKISGETAFFSWASKGNVGGYSADEASIQGSEAAITEFLLDFSRKSGASKVHLIAHSMGNRGLLRALEKIQHQVAQESKVPFGQIILAAPDLDVQLFRNLAAVYPKLSQRTTLYVSPKDKAVGLSKWLHDYPRVGITPPVTVVDDIDTIMVNIDDFNLLELGHGYFAEAEGILHDIFDLLRHDTPPEKRQRPREEHTVTGELYWQIKAS